MNSELATGGSDGFPARRLTWLVLSAAFLAEAAAVAPFLLRGGPGPQRYTSIRGAEVEVLGVGPYRHMPAEVAIQGLAQDLVTGIVAVPFVLFALKWARRGSRPGHLALTGSVGYLFVQYFLYLAMATYNELFLLWVALVLLSSQALFRLLLAVPAGLFETVAMTTRRYVGFFLIVNGVLIGGLWLAAVVPPLIDGRLYPEGLFHLTTMIVQGFDLALFLPPSILAGVAYIRRAPGGLLAPAYAVFVSLQMLALLAKIVWMTATGVDAGPALIIIPVMLVGAVSAATLALKAEVGRVNVHPPTADHARGRPSR
jgi:hypothetical protein